MNAQIATIAIVFAVLIAALAAPVGMFMWWCDRRTRASLEEELSTARSAGTKALEIGRHLLARKNKLAAKVEYMEQRLAPEAPFFRDVEAQEYRETLAKRNAAPLALETQSVHTFPDAI